ncbi:hypothetical protein [Chryseobacterium sp. SNU WT5]|uniref:hypothetical protein n=1 Tax=Chryseobacterium sp. SNU WT5 TaxID=2594269 RepID=UPI00162AE224|nr:hypothetical protein [Chryseobacterium sp. SNU WT5]
MANEFFPPTEADLDQMIVQVQKEMDSALTQLEYDVLHDRLKDLREQRRQLLINNNII